MKTQPLNAFSASILIKFNAFPSHMKMLGFQIHSWIVIEFWAINFHIAVSADFSGWLLVLWIDGYRF